MNLFDSFFKIMTIMVKLLLFKEFEVNIFYKFCCSLCFTVR